MQKHPENLLELELAEARTAKGCEMNSKRGVPQQKQTFHYTHAHAGTHTHMQECTHADTHSLDCPTVKGYKLSLENIPEGGSYTNMTRHHYSEGIFQNCFYL